jgi:HTH-type transcriptional regulator, competence development regulator
MNSFGQKIRSLRETENLLLREVASAIEIDQALLSKIERSERIATKKQVLALSDFFDVDTKKLLTLWLGEKIAFEIEDEEVAHDALRVAEETIKYRTNQKEKNLHV